MSGDAIHTTVQYYYSTNDGDGSTTGLNTLLSGLASVINNNVTIDGGNSNIDSHSPKGTFPPDGTGGFIKFQNSNFLYNVYDAGNFVTGKAFNLIGGPFSDIKIGAHANNMITGIFSAWSNGFFDSNGDQRALKQGYDYKGVIWKK